MTVSAAVADPQANGDGAAPAEVGGPAVVTAGVQSVVLRECLVIGPLRGGGRDPLPMDPVIEQMVAGTWTPPLQAGTQVTIGAETLTWRSATALEDGVFRDTQELPLRNVYMSFIVRSDADRVMMLHARGHGMVYVNTVPRTGDPYSQGYVQLPIELKEGENELLFHVGRGELRAELVKPKAEAFFNVGDITWPDVEWSDSPQVLHVGIPIINATTVRRMDLVVETVDGEEHRTCAGVFTLEPLSMMKAPLTIERARIREGESIPIELRNGRGELMDSHDLKVSIKMGDDVVKHTFISQIDDSVQYYAVRRQKGAASGEAIMNRSLILSLHGAAVEATSQAAAYAPADWREVVAPTNRRPFGFDWEDWGRLDALEVLGLSMRKHLDEPRVYLTGHSMGGHGTWQLGVLYPHLFAAIGPSAGWSSFWSYGGKPPVADALAKSRAGELLLRASSSSWTNEYITNLEQTGIYILHGDADDNVPVQQARMMRDALDDFHTDLAYHEQKGAGHWWGNECVDWPPMMEFFKARSRVSASHVDHVRFITPSPGISWKAHWVGIIQSAQWMKPAGIDLVRDMESRRITGTTENVALMVIDLDAAGFMESGNDEGVTLSIDGEEISVVGVLNQGRTWLLRQPGMANGSWQIVPELHDSQAKTPARCGPFKSAFQNRFKFVYGTAGTTQENAWALAKARYDAETFWYRGNGHVELVADSAFNAANDVEHNVILYGNADTNSAWTGLLGACPLEVKRGEVRMGGVTKHRSEDAACLFVYPRAGSRAASVGVVSGTGVTGMRLTDRLPYFVSGVAYPDWTVLRPAPTGKPLEMLLGAGYFGNDWSLVNGESAWFND